VNDLRSKLLVVFKQNSESLLNERSRWEERMKGREEESLRIKRALDTFMMEREAQQELRRESEEAMRRGDELGEKVKCLQEVQKTLVKEVEELRKVRDQLEGQLREARAGRAPSTSQEVRIEGGGEGGREGGQSMRKMLLWLGGGGDAFIDSLLLPFPLPLTGTRAQKTSGNSPELPNLSRVRR